MIEVAETSLTYDRSTKLRLYAEARIAEYWVVDCVAETIEVHRDPGPDGYRDVRLVTGVATLRPQAFPDVELTHARHLRLRPQGGESSRQVGPAP